MNLNRLFTFIITICASQLLLSAPSKALKCENHFKSMNNIWYKAQLPGLQPMTVHKNTKKSYSHPVLEQIRAQSQEAISNGRRSEAVVQDFKPLSDLIPNNLSEDQETLIYARAKEIEENQGKPASLSFLLNELFSEPGNELGSAPASLVRPRVALDENEERGRVVLYIEELWSDLVKQSPLSSEGSLIPLPYPSLVPGDRFQESYYWDTFFTIKALISTGRLELAAMQVENFLYLIAHYGLVPNGARTYYLSRSQPPLLASMIRLVSDAYIEKGFQPEISQWLKEKALPLVKSDYENFWMNPETRYDETTGLNHHWDSETIPRPERHGADDDSKIGINPQHTRAGAEFAKDFTDTVEGEYGNTAGVLLNAVLYKLEVDMADLYQMIDESGNSNYFSGQAEKRKSSMNRYLWSDEDRTFYDYNLRTSQPFKYTIADTYATLWAGVATTEQGRSLATRLPILERDGGLMSSDLASGKQWDAPFMWAPLMYFAVEGLINYGFTEDGRRLAEKYLMTVDNTFMELGYLIEKMDAETAGVPQEDGEKYETQRGFLWTNGVYLYFLIDVLKFQLNEFKRIQSPLLKKALEKLDNINPEISSHFLQMPFEEQNFRTLFALVKAESWRVYPRGSPPASNTPEIAEDLRRHIIENAPPSYAISDLGAREFYWFYGNSLHGLLIFIENSLRSEFIAEHMTEDSSRKLKMFLGNAFNESNFPGLGDLGISDERALEILDETLDEISWDKIVAIAKVFISEEIHEDRVREWLEAKAKEAKLTSQELRLLRQGFNESGRTGSYCCQDSSGCPLCPNNLHFRNRQ